jgi:hypothetical protein
MNDDNGIDKSIAMEESHPWLKNTRLSRNLQWINGAQYGFCLSFDPFLFSSFAVRSDVSIPSFSIFSVAFATKRSKLVPSANLAHHKMMSIIKDLQMGHCLKFDDRPFRMGDVSPRKVYPPMEISRDYLTRAILKASGGGTRSWNRDIESTRRFDRQKNISTWRSERLSPTTERTIQETSLGSRNMTSSGLFLLPPATKWY